MFIAFCAVLLMLFVVPCCLRWRWLCLYGRLATVGLALLWQNYLAHRHEGNGFAQAMAEAILFAGTVVAISGVLARLLMLALRRVGMPWRYAWLPAPIMFVLLIAWPWLVLR